MKPIVSFFVLSLSVGSLCFTTKTPPGKRAREGQVFRRSDGQEISPYNTVYYFDQLIDHNNASLGTFKQRYWHTAEFYETGGPIVLYSPGEADAELYTSSITNATVPGYLAQTFKGSTILLEHRFYGESNPIPDLKGTTLAKYHTIEQAMNDLEYFAKNVKLPMHGGDQLGPDKAPWILSGCSYMGALTAWTMHSKPGLFHAAWSSSAPVQAIYDFWRYYEPIREHMPQNCSSDVSAVVSYVDKVLSSSDATKIHALKETFGMGDVTDAGYLAYILATPLFHWQKIQPDSGPSTPFGQFCDALEVNERGESAPKDGWGLDHGLSAWGDYYKKVYLPRYCGKDTTIGKCLNSDITVDVNAINTAVGDSNRSWKWFVCNEVGWYQTGAPSSVASRLVSQYLSASYMSQFCKLNFPDAPTDAAAGVNRTNSLYGGWNLKADRLLTVVGRRDPWREATLGASTLNRPSTDRMPIIFADGGSHCSDITIKYARFEPSLGSAVEQGFEHMRRWLGEWKDPKIGSGTTTTDTTTKTLANVPGSQEKGQNENVVVHYLKVVVSWTLVIFRERQRVGPMMA
ncbi:hypothetical protein L218DRAFT_1081344 [Marasmius fiardii PR-910]|nr:hypothetical protein L218DRAFT_1081344 [Marasmius fiardii PR-910]